MENKDMGKNTQYTQNPRDQKKWQTSKHEDKWGKPMNPNKNMGNKNIGSKDTEYKDDSGELGHPLGGGGDSDETINPRRP